MHRCQRQRVGRDRVAQGIAAIFSCDLRAVLGADSGLVQENVHLEARDCMRVETERSVVNRVERIVEEPLWGFNVRSFAVGFDNDEVYAIPERICMSASAIPCRPSCVRVCIGFCTAPS